LVEIKNHTQVARYVHKTIYTVKLQTGQPSVKY